MLPDLARQAPEPPCGALRSAELAEFQRKLRRRTAPGPGVKPPPAAAPILYPRDLPRRAPPSRPRGEPFAGPLLEERVAGAEAAAPRGGKAFVIEVRLADREEDWTKLRAEFPAVVSDPQSGAARHFPAACRKAPLAPEDVVFLDLETTGLSSSPLFLAGTMAWEAGDFVLRQYFARTYAEEAAVVSLAVETLARKRLLVSFNGKSFDLPYLRTRAAANGIPFRAPSAHLDLLHASRRVWRRVLPDCKLQTLESFICRRRRRGDIPGHEIPDAYHAFVRDGDPSEMIEVLRHNALDLITLADLMARMPGDG